VPCGGTHGIQDWGRQGGSGRAALSCFETTVGSTGTRQAHAAFPAPDGSYILVANQNGKRLERIDANFTTNTFAHNPAATLDLLTCTTPSGARCEDPALRPINWPICPIIDASSRLAFVTLRGGGMFVVNTADTPMTIAAEYDSATVQNDEYLWVMDRHANVAEIVDVASGQWIGTVNLAGGASSDPAPDLADRSPSGNRLFVALRGSVPLSGDPHNATGSTPGLGIIQVTSGGRDGKLMAVVPLTNPLQRSGQQPDAHGLRVRERK
jgi:hypothetical protein